jgi:alkylation response protein AidB-like acyl-CoA dehydrogenase
MGDEMVDESPELAAYREQVRSWLDDNLERRSDSTSSRQLRGVSHTSVADVDAQRPLQRKVFEGGYAGITWPTDYGGQGLTDAHERVFNEEARGYVLPDLGIAGGLTTGVCGPTMLRHASPEFLRRHIPRMLAGEELWVQFFSEPEAGSDLAGVRTRATRDGDRWILNGSKIWTSGALYADYGMCLARTNWEVPKHRGLTWFAVSTHQRGVSVQPIREINGAAEFCQEFFDDVELTDDDVIGELDQGWTMVQTMLVFERGAGMVNTQPRRTGPRALAPDLVALARRTGRTADPHVRQLVARAHVNDYVQEQLGQRVAALMHASEGMNAGVAAYGKLAAGTFDPIRARIGIEIGRADALLWDAGDVDAMTASLDYLNGRIMSIAGGTNEMQRNGIGERVLGLPREPSFDSGQPFSEVVRNAQHWTGKVG